MTEYPNTLPLPDYGTYAGVVNNGLQRTTVLTTDANQIIRFNSPRADVSMTFSMDNDIYALWFSWVQSNGYYWFSMPVVSPDTPTDITSVRTVRFTGGVQYQKAGDNWLRVTVGVELLPGEPVS